MKGVKPIKTSKIFDIFGLKQITNRDPNTSNVYLNQ